MKAILAVTLAATMLLFFAGCHINEPQDSYFSFLAEHAVYPYGTASITAIMTNSLGLNDVIHTTDFSLEKLYVGEQHSEWNQFAGGLHDAMTWSIPYGSAREFTVIVEEFIWYSAQAGVLYAEELPSGYYRFVAFAQHDRYNPYDSTFRTLWGGLLWAEFEIAQP